jgi:hypothetical protein
MLRRLTEQERGALKAEFLRQASEAFERTFDAEGQRRQRTFTELEERACEVGDGLTRLLLERRVGAEEAAGSVETYPCPDCGRPTLGLEDEPPPERDLVTRRGALRLARPERACPACRRALFPPRP